MNIQPTRSFTLLYIVADSLFILAFLALLLWKKRYQTLIFALFGGFLYFAVDYGYFYFLSHSREIYISSTLAGPGLTGLVLLWMSLSYGITNFAYIWISLTPDKAWKKWIGIILSWWVFAPGLKAFPGGVSIVTTRTTGQYHFPMLLILLVGYLLLLVYCLYKRWPFKKTLVLFLKLNLIGITVQLAWEGALLLGGIRPLNATSGLTLLIDSLIETNLGMPYILLIFALARRKRGEDLKPLLPKKAVETPEKA